MDRVVLELVDHVLHVHERIINGSDDGLGVVHGGTTDKAADATEAVDANSNTGVCREGEGRGRERGLR